MSNIKDVDLQRQGLHSPPFLLIVSPTPPVQSVDAYVRTLGQSRDNQMKRGCEWGGFPHVDHIL